MHVGLIIYGSLETISGGYLYDRKLVEYLRRAGDTVEVIALPWRSYPRHLSDNFARDLYRRLLRAPLDVLLQDELNHPSLFRLNDRLRKQIAYPIVSIVHHLRCYESHPAAVKWLYRLIERHYLASVDGFIFNSATTRRAVAATLHIDQSQLPRSVVAYPAGDRFMPGLARGQIEQRAHASGPLRLIFVGNLIPRKGLHVLLEALTHLPAGTWRLRVIGNPQIDRQYARRIQRFIRAHQLTGVELTGMLSDDELAQALGDSQMLVVPSDYEGFGIVYLEGMSFGLPALATTSGAASEIITDNENGFLVPPNDPLTLALRLKILIDDRTRLSRMSLAARDRFLKQPRWDESVKRIREMLCRDGF